MEHQEQIHHNIIVVKENEEYHHTDIGITFKKITAELLPNYINQYVKCYRLVFAEEPWFEWKKCSEPGCPAKWGLNEKIPANHCGCPVIDFWDETEVANDLMEKIDLPGTSCWFAFQGEEVVGFILGFLFTLDELEIKLKAGWRNKTSLDLPIVERIKSVFGNIEKVGYLSDMGLINSVRGKKLARHLFNYRLIDFKKENIRIDVARTKTNPGTVIYKWFAKINYSILCHYPDTDCRIILAKDLSQQQ